MTHASYISTDYRHDIPFKGNGRAYGATPDGWRPPVELSPEHGHVNCLLANGAIVKGWATQNGTKREFWFWTFNKKPGAGHARIAPVGWKPIIS
jgi:hypothetical protein